jgi:glycosyltransferase involved in cell wall biosynthesis
LREAKEVARFAWGSARSLVPVPNNSADQAGRRLPGKRLKLGILANELFSEDVGRMGGFGWAVQRVSCCFSEDPSLGVDVVILMGEQSRAAPSALHGSRVLWLTDKHRDPRSLRCEQFDLLLCIDYYPNYRNVFYALPRVPVILWARDPWDAGDRNRIASCRIPGKENLEPPGLGGHDYWSLQSVLRSSRLVRRPFLFAATTPFIAAKLGNAYGVHPATAHILPNIIPPVSSIDKAARPTVLFLGRLDPIKRPWIFTAVAERCPHADFAVLGKNHFPGSWEPQHLPANLRLLGHADETMKREWLSKAWVLLSTSLHEGLCVAFLEALACETPLVACVDPEGIVSRFGSYVGNYPGTGLEVVPALAQAVNELLADTERRLRLGRMGRAWVSETHSRAKFLDAFFSIASYTGVGNLSSLSSGFTGNRRECRREFHTLL